MRVIRCDLCRKKIKKQPVIIGVNGFFRTAELCEKCGLPVLRFLKKHKLVEAKSPKRT